MASTYTVNKSIAWASYYIGSRTLALTNSEPALTAANLVQQVMLQPPMKWRWNRNSNSFAFTGGDTLVAIADFGFIEKAYVIAGSGPNSGTPIEIPQVTTELTMDSGQGRPTTISPYLD